MTIPERPREDGNGHPASDRGLASRDWGNSDTIQADQHPQASDSVMNKDRRGLAVILHSGSYDRVYHGLSIALTALGTGREVRLLFTYWALEYLRRGQSPSLCLDAEGESHRAFIENSIAQGHMKEVSRLLADAKQIGAKIYACVSSMAFLNIARDELIDEVDASTGIATFLVQAEEDQILYV